MRTVLILSVALATAMAAGADDLRKVKHTPKFDKHDAWNTLEWLVMVGRDHRRQIDANASNELARDDLEKAFKDKLAKFKGEEVVWRFTVSFVNGGYISVADTRHEFNFTVSGILRTTIPANPPKEVAQDGANDTKGGTLDRARAAERRRLGPQTARDVGRFPIKDKEWAKTLRAGDRVEVRAEIDKIVLKGWDVVSVYFEVWLDGAVVGPVKK
jgi:hypothetical protein